MHVERPHNPAKELCRFLGGSHGAVQGYSKCSRLSIDTLWASKQKEPDARMDETLRIRLQDLFERLMMYQSFLPSKLGTNAVITALFFRRPTQGLIVCSVCLSRTSVGVTSWETSCVQGAAQKPSTSSVADNTTI